MKGKERLIMDQEHNQNVNKITDNMQKYENYKEQMGRLKRALSLRFYIEAIAIEYSIFEDRTASALRHAEINTISSKGNPLTLSRKLNKIQNDLSYQSKPLKGRKIPYELIEHIKSWKYERDDLIHALLSLRTTTEQFQKIAEQGNKLIRLFSNKVAVSNRYYDKQKE